MNIAILGGGPAGLCAAWNLVQDGHRVIVFEKEPVCGGQSLTFEKDGYRYDLGPHNIHSRRKSVLEFLGKHLGDGIADHPMQAQIYFRGQRIHYPLVGVQVLQSLPFATTLACGCSFLWRRAQSLLRPSFHDDGTYETWVVNRFGRRFYDIFFGPYTQKTWGIPPAELSETIAQKRIAVRGIPELINSVLFKKELYHAENPRLIRNLYPRLGVGTITDFFVDGIRRKGGIIENNYVVEKICLEGNRVVAIGFAAEDAMGGMLDFRDEGGPENWQVFSTLPINELMFMLEGHDVPDAPRYAAKELDFTAEIFLYLNLKQVDAFHVELLYFSENEFPFNRIYDVGMFSRAMVPEGKNALCLELTCTYNDAVWRLTAPEVFEKCMLPLERHGLLNRQAVEAYHIRRLAHAYPRFRVGYQQKLRTIFDYLTTLSNLKTFGRQGLFAYANVDDVIWMAFEMVKELPYRERLSLPIEELLPEYINF
jgi:protoporphyrinogen oxidase